MLKRQADKFENTLKTHLSFAYSDYVDEPSPHSEIYMSQGQLFSLFYGKKIEMGFEGLSSFK